MKEIRLQTKYKKVMTKFNELLEAQIELHKLLDKAEVLYEETVLRVPLTNEQSNRYEQIDHQLTHAMACCERR